MESGDRSPVSAVGIDRVVLTLAGAVIVVGAFAGQEAPAGPTDRGLDGWALAILVAGALVIFLGGKMPAVAAILALGLTFTWYGVGFSSGLVNLVTMAAFYRLGVGDRPRAKVAVTVVAVAATFLVMAVIAGEGWAAAANAAGYVVVAVLFGELLRNRRLLVEQYAQRAQRAEADAERRVAEERMAIARDLHDVLAHTVSVMNVQAGVAADCLDRDPGAARRALGALRAAGREALSEVRATVTVLRAGSEEVSAVPAPGLEHIPQLAETLRAQGLEVHLDIDQGNDDVSPVVGLTAYRVVQEAVTNIVRHSDAATVWFRVVREHDQLTVEVRDDGTHRPTGPAEPGMGLRGMAERVAALDGVLRHGHDDPGWAVVALIPIGSG